MFTYSMNCILTLAVFSCDAGDPSPTSDVINLLEEFEIIDFAAALSHTVYVHPSQYHTWDSYVIYQTPKPLSSQATCSRSIARRTLKFGVYPQHVTWFDANATCTAEGFQSLVHGNDNIRKSMAFNSILLSQENYVNFEYWSGYVRLDPCNANWSKSSCDSLKNDEKIAITDVTASQKQCATLNFNESKALGRHTGRFCSELHPFICKMVLGNVMFTKLNDSLVPVSRTYLQSGNFNVSVSESTGVSQCMARCSRSKSCTAFTFRYDNKSCWLQTSETAEEVYHLFEVGVNVSSYVKDGYQYDINGNSAIQNASEVFICSNGSTYNYTLTSPYEINCSESTGNGVSVGSEVVTLSSGSSSSQTSSKLSSSITQTSSSPNHHTTFLSSSNSGTTSVSNPSTTSTMTSSRFQTHGTFSGTQRSSTSSTSPVPHAMCQCPCSSFYEIQNLNQAGTSTDIEEVIRKSEIPKRKTGKFQRKLQSATDDRPSSLQIGAVSVVVIVCAFGIIIVLDILKLFKHCSCFR